MTVMRKTNKGISFVMLYEINKMYVTESLFFYDEKIQKKHTTTQKSDSFSNFRVRKSNLFDSLA